MIPSVLTPRAARPAAPLACPPPRPSAIVAERALQVLAGLRDTRYQHVPDIDVARGRFRLDCSELVSWLLDSIDPVLLAAVRAATATPTGQRVRARQFHDAFAAAPGLGKPAGAGLFNQVARAADLEPGDIIATKNPLTEANTGHVMVVVGAPEPVVRNGQTVAYTVRVADSTGHPHASDSRDLGKTGVGTGVIALGVDASGRVSSYYRRSYDPAGPTLIDRDLENGRAVDRIAIGRACVI